MEHSINWRSLASLGLIGVLSLNLSACGGDDAPVANQGGGATANPTYQLTLRNLTAGQPLSPAVAIVHSQDYRLFEIGQAAGDGLERLAEGAETATLLEEVSAHAAVKASATSSGGPVAPGASTTFTVTVADATPGSSQMSLVSMLVNSNDAIAALDSGFTIGTMAVGQSAVLQLKSYDTGTEANSETAATIPGPAGGGEGFNPARDDIRDAVHAHSGPVTHDDGLAGSTLGSIHRWQQPVAQLTVLRLN